MATQSVQLLLDDVRLVSADLAALAEAVRALVKKDFKPYGEEVKYGGIMFSSGVQFCGVFVHKEHVTVEFGFGAKIVDPFGHLEGSGAYRRHLRFKTKADLKDKCLAQYLPLALEASTIGLAEYYATRRKKTP
jgi:hypothetical protein